MLCISIKNHRKMKDIFEKYLHSKITSEEFEQFADFVMKGENTDSVYKMMMPELESSLQDTEELIAPKAQVFQCISQRIVQDEFSVLKRKVKIYSLSLRVAAILVFGLIIGSTWFYTQSGKGTRNEQMQTVSIPYGAKTKLSLPDGSLVWLNSGSTLSYSDNFSEKRQVLLKGEAFFKVQKSKIPFEVNTDYGKIRVLGTVFNVLAYPESGFVTTLVSGSVRVEGALKNQEQILKPGDQAQLEGNKLIKTKVDTELFTSWKDGKMILRREPFPSLMKRLERWFNVKIEYKPEDFKDLWYSGTIEMETITEVMDMISTAAPVLFTFNNKTRTIKVAPRK